MKHTCFNCNKNGTELYGYTICNSCKKDLRLFTKGTVKKYIEKFSKKVYQKNVQQ